MYTALYEYSTKIMIAIISICSVAIALITDVASFLRSFTEYGLALFLGHTMQ